MKNKTLIIIIILAIVIFVILISNKSANDAKEPLDALSNLIGDYIDYTPTSATFTANNTYSGYTNNQTFLTNENLKWRILAVNENTLTLISEDIANEEFYLSSYQGYNNGVLLLNEACKAMYSNSALGAIARSVKIEDIEAVSTYNKTNSSEDSESNAETNSYGTTKIYYPKIFTLEIENDVDGTEGMLYSQSQQTSYITQTSTLKATSYIVGTNTSYKYEMADYIDSVYLDMFTCRSENTNSTKGKSYWIASRCAYFGNSNAQFSIYSVSEGDINYNCLYSSFNDSYSYSLALRPVVTISLDCVSIGISGSGTSSDPWSIE